MNRPKMILFDYGQTLVDEGEFDGLKGTEAVLKNCLLGPSTVTAREIQDFAETMNREINRFSPDYIAEIHQHPFSNYLYEYFGMSLGVPHLEMETVFWDNAAPGSPTPGIGGFLGFLADECIRTGVISNIAFSGEALKNRINACIPVNHFEFILASSEYVFRKPHPRIYEMALRKAGLSPEEVWYCGDNAVCDVDGAFACGITPVWYKGRLRLHELTPKCGRIEVESWDELRELIQGMKTP